MNNFKMIYKILSALEKAMDYESFDINAISPEKLNITEERWKRYIIMLADDGYITGVRICKDVSDELNIELTDIRITLKGLEYLETNSTMVKIYKAVKGTRDLIM